MSARVRASSSARAANRAVSIPMKSIAEAKANAVKLDTRALHKAVQHNLALLEAVAATGGRLTARLAAVTLAITTSFR